MKTVYLIRHGECQANIDGILAGADLDSPLTQKGKDQARQAASQFIGKGIDVIVASPLSRALDSASIIASSIDVDPASIITTPLFIERKVGVMSGQPLELYFAKEGKEEIEGAESEEAMYDRVKQGIDWLKTLPGETILLVSHNGTGRMVQAILEGKQPHEFKDVKALPNSGVYEFNL